MNEFFGTSYAQEDLQQMLAQRRAQHGGGNVDSNGNQASAIGMPLAQEQLAGSEMDMTSMLREDGLGDIMMQNDGRPRRQSLSPQPYSDPNQSRRHSMLDFGAPDNGISTFQFSANAVTGAPMNGRLSLPSLDMAMYGNMNPNMNMPNQEIDFSTTMGASNPLTVDTNVFPGMSNEMMQDLMSYSPMAMDGLSAGSTNLNMFSAADFAQVYGAGLDSLPAQYMMTGNLGMQSQHNGIDTNTGNEMNTASSNLGAPNGNSVSQSLATNARSNTNQHLNSPRIDSSQSLPVARRASFSANQVTTPDPTAQETDAVVKSDPQPSQYRNIYSQSGFDMLGALIKVASRQNPEINLGKVDLSCAFVVCDTTQHDCPIVYVSEIFERLTGYTKYEVLGRNCRFLQSPDGKVQAGTRREFVDHDSVDYLRDRIAARKEAQRSLINYRKGGQPFMNLLTMIPITGEDDRDIKYYVGFQVDLVEKPASVEAKGINGMYTVDYTQGSLPQYTWQPPELSGGDSGQTISRDDVSTVLAAMKTSSESEISKRLWDKVLLENTDDVVHVISLKGLFLYISPSCHKVLEYDPAELMGTALSSICHPSDIVPVTRELKDTSNGAPLSIVFRIRRKTSGYTWFESHGSLQVEQGKGRKFIILVGRERPVYALSRRDLDEAGGIGENEFWAKLSTSGMFLFVSSNVRTFLDRDPDTLVGTSIQDLMRPDSKIEFGRTLEEARSGKRITLKHEVLSSRGLGLAAQTTLYPGDATEGLKPTFLVAQTRLLKANTRAVASTHSVQQSGIVTNSSGKSVRPEHSNALSQKVPPYSQTQHNTETTSDTNAPFVGPITEPGGAGLPIGTQDLALASEENIFDELKTTRCTSWQFELRQMEKSNRVLADELASLLSNKKKRKRRRGAGHLQRDCANCHTRNTPEWRRGPSGQRDLCNSCGLRWAKQTGRVSPRTTNKSDSSKTSHHSAGSQSSPPHKDSPESQNSANQNPKGVKTMKGDTGEVNSTALPASRGGRSTAESQPFHKPSIGFREGGARGITNIGEEGPEEVIS